MRALQIASLAAIAGLLLITGVRQLFIDPLPTNGVNVIWLTIQVVPLLPLTPGILGQRVTAYFFAVMVAMLYFVHGVQASFGPTSHDLHLWGQLEAFVSIALVGFASYAIRALRAQPH